MTHGKYWYLRNNVAGLRDALIAALLLAACAPLAQADEAQDIALRYSAYCSVCHGDDGDGDSHAVQGLVPPPKDFSDPAFVRSTSRERLIEVIRDGKPGTAMVAWNSRLSDAEIAELADYLIDNFMRPQRVGQAPAAHVAPRDEALVIYQESCSVCHGDDGAGAVWGQESLATAPRDFTTLAALEELTRERMITAVTYGRPGTPMPGFSTQLTAEQIAAVVDHIRGRFMQPADAAGHEIMTQASASKQDSVAYHAQPLPGGLRGDPAIGRSYYMANCVECHGMAGDGQGPRAYFIFPKPRSFMDPATQEILNRPRLFTGIRDGVAYKEMPAWSKVMSDQQIADIAEFVYREFISEESAE